MIRVVAILIAAAARWPMAEGPGGPPAATLVDFPTTVLPLLTKAGCNSGACHGAATGQGGFHLSLLGHDPEGDHEAITRERGGRRIEAAAPEESLIFLKPTRRIPHQGGRRFEDDSPAARTLLAWIAAGASYGPRGLRIESIDVTPPEIFLPAPELSRGIRVVARRSDGTSEEVSDRALYTASDEGRVEVDGAGKVTTRGRGLSSVMVRYGGRVAAVRVTVPFEGPAGATAAGVVAGNSIDAILEGEWRRLRLTPAPLSGPAEFLRRATLDLAGRLPALEEVRGFLAAPDSQARRIEVIDRLLASPGFTDLWTLKLADLLLVSEKRLGEAPARAFHAWIRSQVARNRPLDALVRELLTARGAVSQSGAANFLRLFTDPRDEAEFAGRCLLGIRLACARCHDHPIDRWKQEEHLRFAAIFSRVRFDGGAISIASEGSLPHPRTGKAVLPRLLDGSAAKREGDAGAGDDLEALASWIASPRDPFFPRAWANRVWRDLFGQGLVEPVDDLRASNPAVSPELLDALAAAFVGDGFDLRRLVRAIASSRAYQLSSLTPEGAPAPAGGRRDRLFSIGPSKPLGPQVLQDAIAQVTGVPDEYPGYPAGTRALELRGPETPSYPLDVLGRCRRETLCETGGAAAGGGLSAALHRLNSPELQEKLRRGAERLLRGEKRAPAEIVEDLYLRALTRLPRREEVALASKSLAEAPSLQEGLEDLLWAVVTSAEFATSP